MSGNLPKNLYDAIEEANTALEQADSAPFSDKAYESLRQKISDYIGNLISESLRISKRNKADIVSQNHIEQANEHLISKRRSKLNYLAGTLGGIFLGATVSNIFGMMALNQTYSSTGIIITVVIGVVGSFLISINLNNN